MNEIRIELQRLRDDKYRDFQIALIPTVSPGSVIGVRTPELRKLAKSLIKSGDAHAFLKELPHVYFDEYQLHSLILSESKDFDVCVSEVTRFLPYIDNWASCDQLSPKVFAKHREELLPHVWKWFESKDTYSVRFAVKTLMQHYLDDPYDVSHAERIASLKTEEYYLKMVKAWYFATALAKQYESALPFIEGRRLDVWTHNKIIQKALESYRIPQERKDILASMRIRRS